MSKTEYFICDGNSPQMYRFSHAVADIDTLLGIVESLAGSNDFYEGVRLDFLRALAGLIKNRDEWFESAAQTEDGLPAPPQATNQPNDLSVVAAYESGFTAGVEAAAKAAEIYLSDERNGVKNNPSPACVAHAIRALIPNLS
jgi:hypothetical protein